VVGCEPADVDEGIGLSAPVERAVDRAVAVVRELIDNETSKLLVQQREGE
jgi:hydrogenase maturation protease